MHYKVQQISYSDHSGAHSKSSSKPSWVAFQQCLRTLREGVTQRDCGQRRLLFQGNMEETRVWYSCRTVLHPVRYVTHHQRYLQLIQHILPQQTCFHKRIFMRILKSRIRNVWITTKFDQTSSGFMLKVVFAFVEKQLQLDALNELWKRFCLLSSDCCIQTGLSFPCLLEESPLVVFPPLQV